VNVTRAPESTCDWCEQTLGQVSVTTVGGERLHPDCYAKWRDEVLAKLEPENRVLRLWGTRRGLA
jgi:hypothetical protein